MSESDSMGSSPVEGEQRSGGLIVDTVLNTLGIDSKDVEKVKEILDMIEMTEEKIVISVGSNIEINIKK
jgi:hypothetical protein